MALRSLLRSSALSAVVLFALGACATREVEPMDQAAAAPSQTAAAPSTNAVEPVVATAEPVALKVAAPAPQCVVPRLHLAYAGRAQLAEEQAARLAAESQAARAAAEAQRPVRLQPAEPAPISAEPSAQAQPDTLRSEMPVAPMDPNMAAVLDAPQPMAEPAARLPGYDLTPEEAEAAYACLEPQLTALYGQSGHALATRWQAWERLEQPPILVQDAFGMRWLVVYGNDRVIKGRPLEGFVDREFVVGAVLGMPSFTVTDEGVAEPGPLFLVEKMPRGFSGPYGNWRFTEIPAASRDIRPQISRGGKDAVEPIVCADCTARGLDAVYLTLVRGGTPPAEDELKPYRDLQRPAAWYPPRERTPALNANTQKNSETKAAEPEMAPAPKAAEEPAPLAPDAPPPVTTTSMRG